MNQKPCPNKAKILAVLLACTCLASIAMAAAPASSTDKVNVEARYFFPQLTATAKSDKIHILNSTGSEIDFKDTLGIDNKGVPELKASWKNWEADYIQLHQDGNKVLDNAITYEGKTFPAGGEPTHTKLNVDYLSLNWKHDLNATAESHTYWKAGLKFIRLDTTVSGAGQSSSKTFTGVIPTIGFGASTYLDHSHRLSLSGEISGMTLGGRGHIYDIEAGLKYAPSDQFNLSAGYRLIDAKLDSDDERAAYKVSGPFIGLAFNF